MPVNVRKPQDKILKTFKVYVIERLCLNGFDVIVCVEIDLKHFEILKIHFPFADQKVFRLFSQRYRLYY